MAVEGADVVSTGGIIWSAILTIGLSIMGYFARKRDDRIDFHDTQLSAGEKAHATLELKIAENYMTKTTGLALFKQASDDNKEAISRVEKRIDETNVTILRQSDKIDKVSNDLNQMGTNIMTELAKKT